MPELSVGTTNDIGVAHIDVPDGSEGVSICWELDNHAAFLGADWNNYDICDHRIQDLGEYDASRRIEFRTDAREAHAMAQLDDGYHYMRSVVGFDVRRRPLSGRAVVDGRLQAASAFERSKLVTFPTPLGVHRAYTMPFRDQLYYPATMGAKTAIARIALDPPWLAPVLSALLRVGLRRLLQRGGARGAVHALIERLRNRYADRNDYALVVDVRGAGRAIRCTLAGRQQAEATAVGVAAITEALWTREMDAPGVWLPEQVIASVPFLARLAAHGIVPSIEDASASLRGTAAAAAPPTRRPEDAHA